MTVHEPSQTATNGSHTVPAHVIVTQSPTWSPVFVPLVFARRVISVSFVYLFVAVSVISSVSRTTTPVWEFTESTAHPPPPVISVRVNSLVEGL